MQRFQASVNRRGFTLIELLVVVAIIALLISILLPSLQRARDQAKAVQCATNMRQVAAAVAVYLANQRGVYPAAYMYATSANGDADPFNQPNDASQFGYVHWSYALYGRGEVDDKSFACPSMEGNGMPRTNPGPDPVAWTDTWPQIDDKGNTRPATFDNTGGRVEDRQALRMAFAANAAVMPRNKFVVGQANNPGPRVNQWTSESKINNSRRVVLATEYLDSLPAIATGNTDSELKVKSHRPINPFYHEESSTNEYGAPLNSSGFFYYGTPGDDNYGLLPMKLLFEKVGVIEGGADFTELNAVGRHHPGGDDDFGGTANFLYTDGSVDRKRIKDTLDKREWGDRYYSLNGKSEVKLDWENQ